MYEYSKVKSLLFTEESQRLFLSIRDRTKNLLKASGAVRMTEAISGHSGDGFTMIACVDRMVEIGELREVTPGDVACQHRVFVRAPS